MTAMSSFNWWRKNTRDFPDNGGGTDIMQCEIFLRSESSEIIVCSGINNWTEEKISNENSENETK